MTKLTYKDFVTGKPKWTRGQFREWTDRQGPLNARYAVIERGRSALLIPEYCLTPESKRAIAYEIRCRETPARVLADSPTMTKPATERKHLFGIVESKRGRFGFFLANAPERCVTREVMREMFAEANEEGLDKPLHIYCCTCLIAGPGMEVYQIGCEGL